AAVWRQLLGIDRIGREDNFFDLGGHSLLLVQAHAALVERLGRSLPVTDLFQFPTIESLAEHLGGGQRASSRGATAAPARPAAGEGAAIAIIGMTGRFPGAPDLETFWSNLRNGVESIRPVSGDELLERGVTPELVSNPRYVKAASTLDEIDQFDAAFFGYSP